MFRKQLNKEVMQMYLKQKKVLSCGPALELGIIFLIYFSHKSKDAKNAHHTE